MQTQPDIDDLDVVVRRRNGRYIAKIPQLGLYATADNLMTAIEALDAKKESLLAELKTAGALEEIAVAPPRSPAQAGVLAALGLFAAKGVIVVALVLAAVGYTRHAVESEIDRIQAPRIGGTLFWANVERNLDRAADPANDLPAARKDALLRDLHVLVDRWRPFVREVDRLFSDQAATQPDRP